RLHRYSKLRNPHMHSHHPPNDPSSLQRRVVIMDAARGVAHTLRLMLERCGHEVRTATDGPTGVELTRAMEPDVVISCIELPGLDGYEVASEIQSGLRRKPLIIAHTAYTKREIGERAKAAGFDLYLARPCLLSDLQRAVAFSSEAAGCEDLQL